MTLPELKALIVTWRDMRIELIASLCGADTELARLTVLCHDIEAQLCKRSRIQRILGDDRAAINRLCEDDEAMERLLRDIDLS